MTDAPHRHRPDLLPIALLLAFAGLLLGVWWLFPWIQHFVFLQDCTATGRTNC